MELPSTSTEGLSNWDDARGDIADGMYTMTEFNKDDMEDGKPLANNPPNNTNTNNTPISPKMRDLSYTQGAKAAFCDRYDSDGNNGLFVPASIMVETVEEDNNIIFNP